MQEDEGLLELQRFPDRKPLLVNSQRCEKQRTLCLEKHPRPLHVLAMMGGVEMSLQGSELLASLLRPFFAPRSLLNPV